MSKLLLILSLCILLSCENSTKTAYSAQNKLCIVQYNVENLFDTEDDPKINDEFYLPSSPIKWDEKLYNKKLDHLSNVLLEIKESNGLDIIALSEIENQKVIEDLIITCELESTHDFVHRNSRDGRGIDVALIYRKEIFEPKDVYMIPVYIAAEPSYHTREILKIYGHLLGEPSVFYLNHWPSRRGGLDSTNHRRVGAANSLIDELKRSEHLEKKENVIILGDFNDEPNNESILSILEKQNYLINPFQKLEAEGEGSYKFRKHWNMLDQIIFSNSFADEKGLEFRKESAEVFSRKWMTETNPKYYGAPFRTFAGYKYLGGYSDHFPVLIQLEMTQD